ncbi:hypothetical protein MP228_007343 [Amoeboaphelidium protococcarum]|nr:hypothetical protein MP228_007343 [Amoeboaphelidium protococcarum]
MVGTRSQVFPLQEISATQVAKKKKKLKLKERNAYDFAEKENNPTGVNKGQKVVQFVNAGYSNEELKCMSALDVLGDGNCLLRAISQGYHGDENRYMNVREMAAKELIENWSYYKTDRNYAEDEMEKSLKQLSNDTFWCGTEELEIIANGIKAIIQLHTKTRRHDDGTNVKINAQRLAIPSRHVWNKDVVYPVICITWDKVETSVHFQYVQLNGVRPRLLSCENVVQYKRRTDMAELRAFLESQYPPMLEYNVYDSENQQGIDTFLKDFIPIDAVDPDDYAQLAAQAMIYEKNQEWLNSQKVAMESCEANQVENKNDCNQSSSMSEANLLLELSAQAVTQNQIEQTRDGDQDAKGRGVHKEVASNVVASNVSISDPLKLLVGTVDHVEVEQSIIPVNGVPIPLQSAQEQATVVQDTPPDAKNGEKPRGITTGIYDDGSDFYKGVDSDVSMPVSQSRSSVDCDNLTVTTVSKSKRKKKKRSAMDEQSSSSEITFKVKKSQIAELLMEQLKGQIGLDALKAILFNGNGGKSEIKQSVNSNVRKRENSSDTDDIESESSSQSSDTASSDCSSVFGDSNVSASNQFHQSASYYQDVINASNAQNMDQAYQALFNHDSSTRGFIVKKNGSYQNAKHGKIQRIVCELSGSRKSVLKQPIRQTSKFSKLTQCPFQLAVSFDHLTVISCSGGHNHSPYTKDEVRRNPNYVKQMSQKASGKFDVDSEICCLFRAGTSTASIVAIINQKLKQAGLNYQLNAQQITYKIRQLCPESMPESAEDVREFLKQMEESEGWISECHLDSEFRLRAVYWLNPQMIDSLSKFGDVVVIDTTYNKNHFGMILATVVLQDKDGRLRFGGAALLSKEDSASFSSFIFWLREKAGWNPSTVYTDGDLALASVLDSISEVNHYLCMFHLKQNLSRNCRKLVSDYDAFEREFMRLASIRDANQFMAQWEKFLQDYPQCSIYLKRALGGRNLKKWPKWAMSSAFTLDLISTSWAESLNAVLSRLLNAKSKLSKVISEISSYQFKFNYEHSSVWREKDLSKTKQSQSRYFNRFGQAFSQSILDLYTSFALNLVLVQMSDAAMYYRCVQLNDEVVDSVSQSEVNPSPEQDDIQAGHFDDDGVVLSSEASNVQSVICIAHSMTGKINSVTLFKDGTYLCTCRYETNKGLPCRHVLTAFLDKKIELCVANTSNPRWFRETPFEGVKVMFGQKAVGTEYDNQWNLMLERASSLVNSVQQQEVDESTDMFQSSQQDCKAESAFVVKAALQSPAARGILKKAFKDAQKVVAQSPLVISKGRPCFRRNMNAGEKRYTQRKGRGRGRRRKS